jgi:phage baseplate assembly protein W
VTQVAFPLVFDASGHTALTSDNEHITDLIEQVLFTAPGERVNRPTFGSGLLQAVFAPAGDAMSAALNMVVQSALQQWLGSLISVSQVSVTSQDSTVTVNVAYTIRLSQQSFAVQLSREGAPT